MSSVMSGDKRYSTNSFSVAKMSLKELCKSQHKDELELVIILGYLGGTTQMIEC